MKGKTDSKSEIKDKKNEILLRRRCKFIVEKGNESNPNSSNKYIATIIQNVESLGFTFSVELIEALKTISINKLRDFYVELISILKNMLGADVVYEPMYPNFPRTVMKASEARLYLNSIVHYLTFGTVYPVSDKEERFPLFEKTNIKIIGLGTYDDLKEIFCNLCNSMTSISGTDREDIEYIFSYINYDLPEEIPLKENVALIGKLYLENYPLAKASDIQKYFKTATDVLRLITAMSDGDISLAKNSKFRSFKRSERRLLLELLENCVNIEEDMLRYKNRWIRVGERIHPGEYSKDMYGKTITAFDKLRNNIKISTFESKVIAAINNKDYKTAVNLLKTRAGVMARKLDWLLRIIDDKDYVISSFASVADNVSTTVLLQVKEHFKYRNDAADIRVFFPKGLLSKCHSIENTLPEIEEKYCDAVVKVCEDALIKVYKTRDYMGKVYLSEALKNYIVPFSQRSASKALKTIVRGSKIFINSDTKAFRGFIWWTNYYDYMASYEYIIDIDLSAVIFDENWEYREHISYTNLKSEEYNACHSGDITNGGPVDGDGVSEFLDVDIESVVNCGGRYVVYQVYSYSQRTFEELPHVMFGWMDRQDVFSGEIYEPKTVSQKLDLVSRSIVCIPVIFDCVERSIIWCDMNLSLGSCMNHYGGNNVESNLSGVTAVCYNMVNMKKPNLYDLIELHIKARGEKTDNKEDADVIFDTDDGITPYDTDVFMGEYL